MDEEERELLKQRDHRNRELRKRDRWWDQAMGPDGGCPEPEPEEEE